LEIKSERPLFNNSDNSEGGKKKKGEMFSTKAEGQAMMNEEGNMGERKKVSWNSKKKKFWHLRTLVI